jgi:hypothetical protein
MQRHHFLLDNIDSKIILYAGKDEVFESLSADKIRDCKSTCGGAGNSYECDICDR